MSNQYLLGLAWARPNMRPANRLLLFYISDQMQPHEGWCRLSPEKAARWIGITATDVREALRTTPFIAWRLVGDDIEIVFGDGPNYPIGFSRGAVFDGDDR